MNFDLSLFEMKLIRDRISNHPDGDHVTRSLLSRLDAAIAATDDFTDEPKKAAEKWQRGPNQI